MTLFGFLPGQADAPWQTVFVKFEPDRVVPRIDEIREAAFHAKHEEYLGVCSRRHSRIPALHLVQCCSTDGCTFREERGGKSTAPTGIADVAPQLA